MHMNRSFGSRKASAQPFLLWPTIHAVKFDTMKAGIILAIAAAAVVISAAGIILIHSEGDRDLTWQYMEQYNPDAAELLSRYTDDLTLQTASHFALLDAGVTESLLGDYPSYWNCMAEACGVSPDGDQDSKATVKDLKALIDKAEPLKAAIGEGKPLVVDGLAAPIFEFTDGKAEEYSNADSTIMRFCVYVETEHDMDLDGKRDLVKVFLQVPRSAMEGNYKAPVIYEGRVYSAGTGEIVYDYESSEFDVDAMYSSPDPRTPAGETDPMEHALSSRQSEWYYEDARGEKMAYDRIDAFDDLLVRGYAFATSSGTGTWGSEGIQTCQSDLEMEAHRSVIEWFAGDAVAYTDRTGNVAIAADWCSGDVGMIGKSYAGCTCISMAGMGIDNLRAVYEYSGMNGMYNYVNSQGCYIYAETPYLPEFASLYTSIINDEEEWDEVSEIHLAYFGKLKELEMANNGDFNSEWAKRESTDVVPSGTAVMICQGLNDYNVMADGAYSSYRGFIDAGMDAKVILHQGGHDYLSDAKGHYDMLVDGTRNSVLVNKWFSHYLFGADNDVTEMPRITMQSADCSSWTSYDDWGNGVMRDYEFPSGTVALARSDLDYDGFDYAEQIVDLDSGAYLMDINGTGLIDGRGVFHLRIRTDDLGRDLLPVSVYLFDVSDEEFEFVDYTPGEADKITVGEGTSWIGGGLRNYDILGFETKTNDTKIVSYGFADLYNPDSTRDPTTCAERTELDGGWYDYNVYLNSTLYEVREGHHLVAAITPLPIATFVADQMEEEIEDYSFTTDLDGSWVSIPFSPSRL